MSNFDENVVNKLKQLEREIERLKTGSEKANPDGWIPVSSTWTYASATTITIPSGATAIYKVGQGIRLTQTTVKYFYIVGVADTVLTITGGSDYTLTNAAISAVSYTNTPSTAIGFPVWFNYTPTLNTGNVTLSGLDIAKFSVQSKTMSLILICTSRNITGSTGVLKIGFPPGITQSPTGILDTWFGFVLAANTGMIKSFATGIDVYKTNWYGGWAGNETGVAINILVSLPIT